MAIPNQIVIDSPTNTVEIQTNDNQLTIVSEVSNTEVNVTQPVTTIIQVATPGPKGDPGVSNQISTGSITASVNIGANTFRVQSGSSTFFYVSSSGNIGIGTNLPSANLHISGASANSLLRVGSPSNANILFVTGSGRVGIGTSTPSELFEVVRSGNTKIVAGTNVGIQTSPSEWIHLNSAPQEGNYIRIDAQKTSNDPPLTTTSPSHGYGITVNKNYLAEPDYWMEIKLDNDFTVVLIPCYLPA